MNCKERERERENGQTQTVSPIEKGTKACRCLIITLSTKKACMKRVANKIFTMFHIFICPFICMEMRLKYESRMYGMHYKCIYANAIVRFGRCDKKSANCFPVGKLACLFLNQRRRYLDASIKHN